jgi:predicted XRE-type DNA-binding protein
MTQKVIAELFGVQRSSFTEHLLNIFEDKELNKIQYVPKWNILLLV